MSSKHSLHTLNKNSLPARKQLKRLAHIVALLKTSDMSAPAIVEEMENASNFSSIDISCSQRTLRRDIEVLRKDYNCPVEYDKSKHVYRLYNRLWDFTLPSFMNNNELLAIIIGGKFSNDILPPSISRCVDDAVNEVIRCNSGEYIKEGRIKALKILGNTGQTISDEIFSTVFSAWRQCRAIVIEYDDFTARHSRRTVEPHALVLYEMQWCIVAYCRSKKKKRIFLVSRIKQAIETLDYFVPDEKIIESISQDNFLGFKTYEKITIKLNHQGLQYAQSHPLRTNQQYTALDGGMFEMTAESVSFEEMNKWILSQIPGDAIPTAPAKIVHLFKKSLREILDKCP